MAVHDDAADERMWLARLRWRLRGAWQWPAFGPLTVADALIAHWLPFSGHDGSDTVAAFIIFGFLNLGLVAVAAPAVGTFVRKRAPRLPKTVASDRSAVALMLTLTAALLLTGVLHHGAVNDAGANESSALNAARDYARAHAPDRFQAGVGRESVLDTGDDLYRVCVAGPDRARNFCMFVDTAGTVPKVRPDSDQTPNSTLAGPDNPGRQVGG